MIQTVGGLRALQALSHLPLELTPGLGMLFSLFPCFTEEESGSEIVIRPRSHSLGGGWSSNPTPTPTHAGSRGPLGLIHRLGCH